MAFFRKNTLLLDLMNKFNAMENKIDTIQTHMNTVAFTCKCDHEIKIYENIRKDLQEFFENKFDIMTKDILNSIPKETNLLEEIINNISLIHDKNKEELINLLNDICKNNNNNNNPVIDNVLTSTELKEQITTLYSVVIKSYSQFDERVRSQITELSNKVTTNDSTLRIGLQDILISIKNDIISNLNNNTNNEKLDNVINEINIKMNFINNRVEGFYFENENMKHQLTLEEDIRKYYDEIDQINILINNVKECIHEVLNDNNYDELHSKYGHPHDDN